MRIGRLNRYPHRSSRPPRGLKLPRKKLFEPVIETEAGVKVRSSYEKECADYLYNNSVEFKYEPLMLLGGRKFRPDFYLPDYNLFVEICGYNHQPYYRDRIKLKQNVYEKNGLNSVFINHDGKGSIQRKLETSLIPFGIKTGMDNISQDS